MKLDAITTQPVVETARFVLRPLRRSDEGLIEFYTKDAAQSARFQQQAVL